MNSARPAFINNLKLRQMVQQDCAEVARLHQLLDLSGWNKNQWQDILSMYPCAWVLTDLDRIQAYICFQTLVPQTELLNIGVARELQGQGIAFNLAKAAIGLLPEQSESIFLEVRRSNTAAIRLYEKLDFKKVGERKDYYSAPEAKREDALIYRCDLV